MEKDMIVLRQKEFGYTDKEVYKMVGLPLAGAGIGAAVGSAVGSSRGGKKASKEELRKLAEKEARKEEKFAKDMERSNYGLGMSLEEYGELDDLDRAEYEMNKQAAEDSKKRAKELRNNPELLRKESKSGKTGAKIGATLGATVGGVGTFGAMKLAKKLSKK